MTPKHTPGPWHVGMKPGPLVYGPQGEQIVNMTEPMLFDEENAENARLIAAAPDLLAALQAVIEQRNNPRRDSDDEHAYQNAFKLAFTAIAKAQGD